MALANYIAKKLPSLIILCLCSNTLLQFPKDMQSLYILINMSYIAKILDNIRLQYIGIRPFNLLLEWKYPSRDITSYKNVCRIDVQYQYQYGAFYLSNIQYLT